MIDLSLIFISVLLMLYELIVSGTSYLIRICCISIEVAEIFPYKLIRTVIAVLRTAFRFHRISEVKYALS